MGGTDALGPPKEGANARLAPANASWDGMGSTRSPPRRVPCTPHIPPKAVQRHAQATTGAAQNKYTNADCDGRGSACVQACKQSMSGKALEMRRGGSVRGPPTLPGVPAKGRACAFGPRSPSHPSTQGWRLHTNPGPSPPPGAQFGLCAVSISNMGRTAKRRSCAYKQRYANKRGASKGREKAHAHKQLRSISIFIPLVLFPFYFPRGVHNPDSPRYSIPSVAPICAAGSGLRIMQSSAGGRCTPASNFPGVRGVWPDDRRLSTPSAAGGPCRAPR